LLHTYYALPIRKSPYTQGLSNVELGNMDVDVSTPNDCDDFLGAHEDADRSNCPG